MNIVADLHIHSRYSRATSKSLTLESLDYWARVKGITIVGTGDITHPEWLKEIMTKLEPAEEGLFKLKQQFRIDTALPEKLKESVVRFMLTGEVSSIYKKENKVRKVHNVIGLPTIKDVEMLQSTLDSIGNITSDGRPILGLDSKELLKITLEINSNALFFPAHIWTPWFAMLGAKSGFDSIEECFEELTPYIHAVEMGLSSNPAMNRSCSTLNNVTLLANSDAHSPEKLGRNASLFDTTLSYQDIIDSIKSEEGFTGTVSLFPQEGKYHYDGHRKCQICLSPQESTERQNICPVCRKPVTIGVTNRVYQLADQDGKELLEKYQNHAIIPLKHILSEIVGVGPTSKKVAKEYDSCINSYGSELDILLNIPLETFEDSPKLQEAIQRMRQGKVHISEGFDGQAGSVKVFT